MKSEDFLVYTEVYQTIKYSNVIQANLRRTYLF